MIVDYIRRTGSTGKRESKALLHKGFQRSRTGRGDKDLTNAQFLILNSHPMGTSRTHFEHRQKGFLGDIDLPDPLHPALAFLLFLEQFPFARDVTAIALRQHVLANRGYAFASDDAVTDR